MNLTLYAVICIYFMVSRVERCSSWEDQDSAQQMVSLDIRKWNILSTYGSRRVGIYHLKTCCSGCKLVYTGWRHFDPWPINVGMMLWFGTPLLMVSGDGEFVFALRVLTFHPVLSSMFMMKNKFYFKFEWDVTNLYSALHQPKVNLSLKFDRNPGDYPLHSTYEQMSDI